MLANVKGLVDRLELSPAKAMMPLFEAISNSIDAIGDRADGFSHHTIRIRLVSTRDLAQQGGDDSLNIDGFDIADDGVGFNDSNLASFQEAHTLSKVRVGGKGVGRFTYLKVFSSVHVRSVFERQHERYLREFDFDIVHELRGVGKGQPTVEPLGTAISMSGLESRYKGGWPNDPEVVAQRIIAHFLIRFAAHSCPRTILEGPNHAPMDLNALFQSAVQSHIEERVFIVLGHEFTIQAYRNKDGRSRHELHLCANGREVVTGKLRDLLPELPERFLDDEQAPYTLIVLVTGEYLDAHANQERTKISFESDDDDDLDETLVSRQALNKGIADTLRPLLVADLKSTNEEKFARVVRFAEQAPEYRVLTRERFRPLIEQRVQPGLKDEQLDEALLHIRRDVEDSMRKEERHVAALIETESFEQYQERIRMLMENMNDVGKAKLADYVAHRRTILDLVGQSLKRVQQDSKYPFERVLHKMIFPMGAASKDIFLEQQNLWLLDERLCFHTLLTSDKKLNKVPGLEGTSGKEPDIFAFFYDTPIGVAEADGLPGGGVVIVEFKRPGRDDYDKDPADQIVQRFDEIAQGGVKDIDGRPINPDRLRYTGYLIADLTPTLHRQVRMRYHKMADNEGYFATLPQGNGYIEIISYDKLVQDAKRRNRVLFDKLGLHKH
ncbi:ATP-binding protein [Paraburkholderia sediminicola]|uniref:ATP-binding protein n=1 Tax=Paraburkholderia sediminicola TaxID=458836 RepID=UPI0038BDC378